MPQVTAWAHLPNAAHIDRILIHVKANPRTRDAARGAAWDAAWDAARGAAWGATRGAAWDAAWGAAWDAARDAARVEVWDAARVEVWGAAWGAARGAARGAIAALVAWDDCAYMLELPEDALKVLIAVGNHQAVLLLPAAIAMQTKGD